MIAPFARGLAAGEPVGQHPVEDAEQLGLLLAGQFGPARRSGRGPSGPGDAGRYRFPDPKDATEAGVELSAAQFAMILDGIDLSRVRRSKRFTPATTC